ncbi:FadR/GntR family transcriptional regulator [Rhizosaccharibacter radicis]|uniref:FadR family transcriptional regulator n=1 Tax=Rhizosaccharibacter radicis TaxID=2782605 RepID=A0ABT1W109_9PROT|nr:FadR family transcriptional regulator [Acetobacteraceae bacterium KSS12]
MTGHLVVIPAGRSLSNHAAVARALGIDIIARRLSGGDKLPSDAELCARFGVSRPVLREAVKTLAAKGLLSTKTRVGTLVRDPAAWNMFDGDVLAWHLDVGIGTRFLRHLADIRLAVEPQAASLAAMRRTEEDLDGLQRLMAEFAERVRNGLDLAEADCALHLAIAAASGNPFMRSIGAVVQVALRASFQLSAPVGAAGRDRTVRTHERIVAAIAGRDSIGAAAAMTEVIRQGLVRHAEAGIEVPGVMLPGLPAGGDGDTGARTVFKRPGDQPPRSMSEGIAADAVPNDPDRRRARRRRNTPLAIPAGRIRTAQTFRSSSSPGSET